MGNLNNKSSEHKNKDQAAFSTRDGQSFTSQFSLSHFVGNLSGRSFVSVTSNQSVYSASRPWSRVSRRRWNDATLKNPLEASKTAWPVAHKESIFLPEFPITTDLLQKDFEIVNTIAKGAFGEVYKVKKLSEDKEYALKLLNKSQIINDNAVRQVKEEAKIQAAVGHHLFIAGSASRWQTKKRLYIVSEYIPGGELLALIEKYGKLPEEVVKIFLAEIAIALDFLHNAGIIYRDLKPENILLDTDYHIRLIDFGLSKWLSIGSRTTTLCGTLKYMAPELLLQPYGHAVDWWSLGVLVCYMLTGETWSPYTTWVHACFVPFSKILIVLRTIVVFKFPTPAVVGAAKLAKDGNSSTATPCSTKTEYYQKAPGTLPECSNLSKAGRALLMRLLEKEPKHRMRSLRMLQQSAFYLGFNFEYIKAKKISPKNVLEQNIVAPNSSMDEYNKHEFIGFDQAANVV